MYVGYLTKLNEVNGRSWVAAPTPGRCGAHGKRMLTKAHVARSYTGLVTRASARQERYQLLVPTILP